MPHVIASEQVPGDLSPQDELSSSHSKMHFFSVARERGLLIVDLEIPSPAVSGCLSLFIEDGIEQALLLRGSPAPTRYAAQGGVDLLRDQLYRARLRGATGVAISFSSLDPIVDFSGRLDPRDRVSIRWLFDMASTLSPPEGLMLRLDPTDSFFASFGIAESGFEAIAAPVDAQTPFPDVELSTPPKKKNTRQLQLEFPKAQAATNTQSDEPERVLRQTDRVMAELFESDYEPSPLREAAESTPPPALQDTDTEKPLSLLAAHVDTTSELVDDTGADAGTELANDDTGADAGTELAVDADVRDTATLEADTPSAEPSRGLAPTESATDAPGEWTPSPSFQSVLDALCNAEIEGPLPESDPEQSTEEPVVSDPRELSAMDSVPMEASPTPEDPESDLLESSQPTFSINSDDSDELEPLRRQAESWTRELESANGPKPLSVIERLFVTAYIPLCEAVRRGAASPRALEVLEDWRQSFKRSYSDGFDALRMRSKRPTMVLDAPDIAMRIGRLHDARGVQLLMIDGMRYDLGNALHTALRDTLGAKAACAERTLLWSALPSRTATQVELLGRGPMGLRDYTGEVDEDALLSHAKHAGRFRRLRTGTREVFKLDLVETTLRNPGGAWGPRVKSLAAEIAESIRCHVETLPPRTLVMIFGDHGFEMDESADSTSAIRQGGASPDEVLVPASAWLIDSVH